MKIEASIWCSNPGSISPYYTLSDVKEMETVGWYKVKDVEIEFEEPKRAEMLPTAIRALEAEKLRILEESNKKVEKIEQQLSQLLALEN